LAESYLMDKRVSLSIIVPALNEEKTVRAVVENTIAACDENNVDWEIILVDDGSTDSTGEIARELAKKNNQVVVITHPRPKGIGCCFRQGVKRSAKEIVIWLPADGENDIEELLKYAGMMRHVDIVIPFVVNTGVRNWPCRFLSSVYLFIINFSFGTTFNYTNGNVMYRRRVFQIIKNDSNGFFFQTECLIKSIRKGFIFAEVPVFLKGKTSPHTKALSFRNFMNIAKDFLKLFIAVHILGITGRTKE